MFSAKVTPDEPFAKVHGFVKPDGHSMDDLWFYDINSHAWTFFVYKPETNSWADPIPFPVDGPRFHFAANTFFDRELNAYFCHVAVDSKDDGVMWVYRYKK